MTNASLYGGCPLPAHYFDRSGIAPGQQFLDALAAGVEERLGRDGGELELSVVWFGAPQRFSSELGHVAEGLLPAVAADALVELVPPGSVYRVGTFSFLMLPSGELDSATLRARVREQAVEGTAWYLLREVEGRSGEGPDAGTREAASRHYNEHDPELRLSRLTLRVAPGPDAGARLKTGMKRAGHSGFWPQPWPRTFEI